MKHYRLNQIAMAVLGALLLFFGAKTLINIAYEEHEPEQPGYVVPGTEEQSGRGGEAGRRRSAGHAACQRRSNPRRRRRQEMRDLPQLR